VCCTLCRQLERPLRTGVRLHRQRQPLGHEVHRELHETGVLRPHQVLDRHANIGERQLSRVRAEPPHLLQLPRHREPRRTTLDHQQADPVRSGLTSTNSRRHEVSATT
jgi:hypothetical protein